MGQEVTREAVYSTQRRRERRDKRREDIEGWLSTAVPWAGVEGAQGEGEDGLEEPPEPLPHQQQADHAEGAQRSAEMLDAARQVFGDEQAESAEAIQRRHRYQIERAQQQVEREHQAHESGRSRRDTDRKSTRLNSSHA